MNPRRLAVVVPLVVLSVGSMVAVVVMNGSNKPTESPFYNDAGQLVLLRVSGTDLSRRAIRIADR